MKVKKSVLKQFVKNDICEIPILYHSANIAFSVAEDFRNRVCVPCWYDCREIFHADYPKPNHVFINHGRHKYSKLKSYIESLEILLKIKKKSEIIKSCRKTATLVILSPFWKNEIKFTLFTLLVRVALYKNFSTFTKDIFSYCKYLHETKSAVNLFISGFTDYIGDEKSWYKQFRYMSVEKCKKLLKR